MKISVTQEHIKNGSRRSNKYCPIALAVKEANPDAKAVFVGVSFMWMRDGAGDAHEWNLPAIASKWVSAFDRHQPVAPFEFEAITKLHTARTEDEL